MSSAAAANAVMMGAGYFTPLTGYMNRADALSVAESMRTTDGLFCRYPWSIWQRAVRSRQASAWRSPTPTVKGTRCWR